MRYRIQKEDEAPAYLQLYRQIRDDIVKGVYPYNTKLPSKRLISDEVGVSTVTTEHAYALLCDEGYVEAKERSGYFVIFRTDDGFAASASQKITYAPPIRRHADTTEGFPFSVLTKAMRGVMNDFGEAILRKSPNAGCSELCEAIGQYLERSRGILADASQIVIGSGSEYLYSLIVELLGRERLYAIELPSYQKIEQVYHACGARYEMLPLGGDGIESTALWASDADVLHISPYRSFPSGITATASKRHEYLRWASSGERYIVEDDFESEFSVSKKPEETLFSHTVCENVIYMNTFSRTISPALRVGYMVLPKRLAEIFEQKLGFYSCTVPTFEQLLLARLISSGDFERHVNRTRRKKRRELSHSFEEK